MRYKFGKNSRRPIDPIYSVSVRSDHVTTHRDRFGMRVFYDVSKSTRARLQAISKDLEREWISDYFEYNIWSD